MTVASLTRTEAEARAALISVTRYDIEVDLTGLLEGQVLSATSTIAFACTEPGASTFVDCVAEIREATLNGHPLDLATAADGRLPLPDLAATNELVVRSDQPDTGSAQGVLRTVDDSDGLVYVWTSFEPDDARYCWACFDQPDLKAPFAFTVHAPQSWTVTSNRPPDSITDLVEGSRVWRFPDTPPLSTYVVVVNAGPFHEVRSERDGFDLGLFCRQSLRTNLERDAEELFEVTAQGLAFFGERFGSPFPQPRYDQVFVPNLGGAMENWGCVTWSDTALHRAEPTHSEREYVAEVLLHEMAHMWFGDLVTMRWWDDLWLNEAFASWAACWAMASATRYREIWSAFEVGDKPEAHRLDRSPATHPIRAQVDAVADAMANFDAITYLKGQSVLRQLVALVGEDHFVEALRAYFAEHAWGNTELADLMSAVGAAAGLDLTEWTAQWLDRSGADTISAGAGALSITAPDGGPPREHRLDLGLFRAEGRALTRVGTVAFQTSGAHCRLPADAPEHHVMLPNDGGLTYATVHPEPLWLQTLLSRAGDLPDARARATVAGMSFELMSQGVIDPTQAMDCLLRILHSEREVATVQPLLAMARRTAIWWLPADDVESRLTALADEAWRLAEHPGLATAGLRALAAVASHPAHFGKVERAARHDRDLAWRLLLRRAELGDYDAGRVSALQAEDPDPDAWVRALAVRAARPHREAKEEAWTEVFTARRVPAGGPVITVADAFYRRGQGVLLQEYADRYLTEVSHLARSGGLLAVGVVLRNMFPYVGTDAAWAERAQQVADTTDPWAAAVLVASTDTLTRMLRARGLPS